MADHERGAIVPDDIRIRAGAQPRPNLLPAAAIPASPGSFQDDDAAPLPGCPSRAINRIGEALQECFIAPGNQLLREVEERLVRDAFEYCDSNQVRTGELLGISRNVVRTLLKRHGLIAEGGETDKNLGSVLAAGRHRQEVHRSYAGES